MWSVKVELKQSQDDKIKDIRKTFNNNPGGFINILHKTPIEFGYLPAEVQEVVADFLNRSVAKAYGVVTSYSFSPCYLQGNILFQSIQGQHVTFAALKKFLKNSRNR
jgi:NADH:ubiquinone oxidoreductase subunit E